MIFREPYQTQHTHGLPIHLLEEACEHVAGSEEDGYTLAVLVSENTPGAPFAYRGRRGDVLLVYCIRSGHIEVDTFLH